MAINKSKISKISKNHFISRKIINAKGNKGKKNKKNNKGNKDNKGNNSKFYKSKTLKADHRLKLQSQFKTNNKQSKQSKKNNKTYLKYRNSLINNRRNQNGGFATSCNLATVKEPGFSVDSLGSISGLSIPESRAIIYKPNCGSSSSYQAMTP